MKASKVERDLQLIKHEVNEMIEMLELIKNPEVLMEMNEELVSDFYHQLIKTNLYSKAYLNTQVILYRDKNGDMVTEYHMGGIHEDIIADTYGAMVVSTIGEELMKKKNRLW